MYYYQPILFFVFDILKTKFTNLICEAQRLGSSPLINHILHIFICNICIFICIFHILYVTYLITDHYHPNHLGLC